MITALALTLLAGNTWYVDVMATPPGDGSVGSPYTSIQFAIDRPTTVQGDVLLVAPGTYVEEVRNNGKWLELRSQLGPNATTIRGFVVWAMPDPPVDPEPVIEGFTITQGSIFTSGMRLAGARVERCIVRASDSPGFGMIVDYDTVVRNCVVAGFAKGVLEEVFNCKPTLIENSIFFDNDQDLSIGQSSIGCGAQLRYCVYESSSITGGYALTGNLVDVDPRLWDAPNGDFHLAPLSPCIDTGDPTQTDPDGSRVDVGAIPYDANHAPMPMVYCTPKLNSKGCAPSVSSTGIASLSGPDNFVLTTASLLNKKNGSYVWSYSPKATPFAGGTLCIKLPLVRGTPLNTSGNPTGLDCSGSLVWWFSQSYMAQKNVPAGAVIYAQAWARDSGFAVPNNSQLSNAIVFGVVP